MGATMQSLKTGANVHLEDETRAVLQLALKSNMSLAEQAERLPAIRA